VVSIGRAHRHNAGYFVNDKALSTRQEADVQTCGHCQSIIKLQDLRDEGGWCSKCQKCLCSQPTCRATTAALGCVPLTKQIDSAVSRAQSLASMLKTYPELPLINPRG
jgi:hypothetical protein